MKNNFYFFVSFFFTSLYGVECGVEKILYVNPFPAFEGIKSTVDEEGYEHLHCTPVNIFNEFYLHDVMSFISKNRNSDCTLRVGNESYRFTNTFENLKKEVCECIAKKINPGEIEPFKIDFIGSNESNIKEVWVKAQCALYYKKEKPMINFSFPLIEERENEEVLKVISVTLQDYKTYSEVAENVANDAVEVVAEAGKCVNDYVQPVVQVLYGLTEVVHGLSLALVENNE